MNRICKVILHIHQVIKPLTQPHETDIIPFLYTRTDVIAESTEYVFHWRVNHRESVKMCQPLGAMPCPTCNS